MDLKELARKALSGDAVEIASGLRATLPERKYINPEDVSGLYKKSMLHKVESGLKPSFDLELKNTLACAISGKPQKTYCIRLQADVSQITYEADDVCPDIGFTPQYYKTSVDQRSIYLAGGISQAQTTRLINLWNMGVSIDKFMDEVNKISPLQEGARDKVHAFRAGKMRAEEFRVQRMEELQRRANASANQGARPQ